MHFGSSIKKIVLGGYICPNVSVKYYLQKDISLPFQNLKNGFFEPFYWIFSIWIRQQLGVFSRSPINYFDSSHSVFECFNIWNMRKRGIFT